MRTQIAFVPAIALVLCGPAAASQSQTAQPPPRTIELDAGTVASHTEAARNLVPLLGPVKEKATARYQTEKGSVPDSPFAGTQTTLFAVTVGKKNQPVDPQVVQAMERLLAWEPANRSATEEAALFDAWMAELSKRASSIATKRGIVACDTGCVVQTITALDDAWGKDERERSQNRDQLLYESFVDAVKKRR